MLDLGAIDLHNFELKASPEEGLVWRPTGIVLFVRSLIGIFLALLAGGLFLYMGDAPWQRKQSEIKQQVREAEFAQTKAQMQEVLAELQRQFPERQILRPALESNSDENLDKSADKGQTASRVWHVPEVTKLIGRMLVAGMTLTAVWLPLSFFWDQVRLWRDDEGKIRIRYWLIWPRTRTLTATANSRLKIWAMELHHFNRRRILARTDWRWVAQLMGSGTVHGMPISKVCLVLSSTKSFPSLILSVQDYAPNATDRLPPQIQKFNDAAFRILRLPADEPQIVPQEIVQRPFHGPLRVSRVVQEVTVPLERTTEYSRRVSDPDELQELIRTMSQGGEVVQLPDGSTRITSSRVVKTESIKQDEIEDFLDNLPPEARRALQRHLEQSE